MAVKYWLDAEFECSAPDCLRRCRGRLSFHVGNASPSPPELLPGWWTSGMYERANIYCPQCATDHNVGARGDSVATCVNQIALPTNHVTCRAAAQAVTDAENAWAARLVYGTSAEPIGVAEQPPNDRLALAKAALANYYYVVHKHRPGHDPEFSCGMCNARLLSFDDVCDCAARLFDAIESLPTGDYVLPAKLCKDTGCNRGSVIAALEALGFTGPHASGGDVAWLPKRLR